MRRAFKVATGMSVSAILLLLIGVHLMCRDGKGVKKDTAIIKPAPDVPITAEMATTIPAGPTQVCVSIEKVIHKKYGLLAHIAGKRDVTVTDEPYEAGKSWWGNPIVVFEDEAFPRRVSARSDAESIAGGGKSSNVSVKITPVPHADTTLNTLAASDCIKAPTASETRIVPPFPSSVTCATRRNGNLEARGRQSHKTGISAASFPSKMRSWSLRDTSTVSLSQSPRSRARQSPPTLVWGLPPLSGERQDLVFQSERTAPPLVVKGSRHRVGYSSRILWWQSQGRKGPRPRATAPSARFSAHRTI